MNLLRSALAVLAAVCLIPVSTTAQTQSQLDRRYPSIKAYIVRPTILMTVKFGRDARTCEIVLEPNRNAVLVENLSQEETIHVVEEVVPESERGKRLEGRDAWSKWLKSDVRGRLITTSYPYELMTVTFNGTVDAGDSMVATVTWKQRSCDK